MQQKEDIKKANVLYIYIYMYNWWKWFFGGRGGSTT